MNTDNWTREKFEEYIQKFGGDHKTSDSFDFQWFCLKEALRETWIGILSGLRGKL